MSNHFVPFNVHERWKGQQKSMYSHSSIKDRHEKFGEWKVIIVKANTNHVKSINQIHYIYQSPSSFFLFFSLGYFFYYYILGGLVVNSMNRDLKFNLS